MPEAIIVEGLGKKYSRYNIQRPNTLMEAVLKGWRNMKPEHHFWVLRDINFTVSPGEMLGVIGKNGAGKSTLLQLIGGVGCPDAGRVKVNGHIGALLDLRASFHYDLTGAENVFISGVIAGLTRRQVRQKFESIVEFAELKEFMNNPVRSYSTGMQMRLAFSVAIHTEPDVLLVDEFLSVGDIKFQSKCLQRISDLKKQGCAIILISHTISQIQEMCDHALWLRQGEMVSYGDAKVVADQYLADMRSETQRRTPVVSSQLTTADADLRLNENRFGSLEAEITNVKILPVSNINSGDPLSIEIEYNCPKPIYSPIFNINISKENGQICFDTNTDKTQLNLPLIQGKGKITLNLDRLDLNSGKYFINIGMYHQNWDYAYDYHWHAYPLFVHCNYISDNSILAPPHHWEFGGVKVPILQKNN